MGGGNFYTGSAPSVVEILWVLGSVSESGETWPGEELSHPELERRSGNALLAAT